VALLQELIKYYYVCVALKLCWHSNYSKYGTLTFSTPEVTSVAKKLDCVLRFFKTNLSLRKGIHFWSLYAQSMAKVEKKV